jgi:GNAT superfamily N-acetyltransferase
MSDPDVAGSGTVTSELSDVGSAEREAWLARVYDEVLRPGFPPNELVPYDMLAQQAAQDPPKIKIMAIDENGIISGAIVGQWYAKSRVLLIAYLAIRQDLRGNRIGTNLIQSAVAGWAEELRADLIIAEVEDPAYFEGRPGEDPQGRLRLYHRFGARRIDTEYVQPELNPGTGRVKGMFMIVAPSPKLVESPDGTAKVSSRIVTDFLAEYFASAEGPKYDDQQFRVLIAKARRTKFLAVLPLID